MPTQNPSVIFTVTLINISKKPKAPAHWTWSLAFDRWFFILYHVSFGSTSPANILGAPAGSRAALTPTLMIWAGMKELVKKHREKYWVFLDLSEMNNIFPAGRKIRVLTVFEKKKCLTGKLSAFCCVTTSLWCYRANKVFAFSEDAELSGSPCLKFPLENPPGFQYCL